MGNYRIINTESFLNTESALGMPKAPNSISDALDYTGQWRVRINPNGYGMGHKIGLKRDFQVQGWDHCLLVVHFAVPVAERERRITIGSISEMYKTLAELIDETAYSASQRFGNVASVYASPTDAMKRELEEILSKTQA